MRTKSSKLLLILITYQMTKFEIYSLILGAITTVGALVFAFLQAKINWRLAKLNSFVALAIVPNPADGSIKLLNSGKINLYIHAFEINNHKTYYNSRRLISAGTLDAAYYWLPTSSVPRAGSFNIKVWLTDEFGTKYVTEGEGESTLIDNTKSRVELWTLKTEKKKW